ncbi:MAG: hypothetical protein RLZZ234_891 [Candidatus Parcubacteria bacterium]
MAAAGVVSVALVAPNVMMAMEKLGLTPTKRQSNSIRNARARLVKEGLLMYKDSFLVLTQKGKMALARLELQHSVPVRPKRWDKKWRVLIFDVPERRKGTRDKIRRTLVHIGFVRMQDSVWLYPYDCEDLVTLLKADMKIGRDLLYMIVDSIEADEVWRKHFNLPKEKE